MRSTTTETEEESSSRPKTAILSPLDDSNSNVAEFVSEEDGGVVCARGVCVVAEDGAPELCFLDEENVANGVVCEPNASDDVVAPGLTVAYLWPRVLLLVCSVLYGTNFPLGRLMNDAMPASAATSTRMVLASVALSPFLFRLKPELRASALTCGAFTALGYVSQSIALVDTPAATVSFLGALVVIVCPALAAVVDERPMSLADAPQTWIAAVTCLVGVGVLELGGGGAAGSVVGWGDAWSVAQAVGFGTSFFVTERMMAREPTQALPITATQCAVSALVAGVWAWLDGTGAAHGAFAFGDPRHGAWLLDGGGASYALPGLFYDPSLRSAAAAAAFTGLVTTAGNRVGETTALGRLSSSEASVLLATEPLWAAVFASALLHEHLDLWDGVGGALIVAACVATAIDPAWLRERLGIDYDDESESESEGSLL